MVVLTMTIATNAPETARRIMTALESAMVALAVLCVIWWCFARRTET
jgi:hypothetical protein